MKRLLIISACVIALALPWHYPSVSHTVAPAPKASAIDYPAIWRDSPTSSLTDSWGYPNRICASYVAYKVWKYYKVSTANWGGFDTYINNAEIRGFAVDHNPAPHSVIIESGGDTHVSHVMWVESVHRPDKQHPYNYVHVSQYNQDNTGEYNETDFPSAGFWFIHFKSL